MKLPRWPTIVIGIVALAMIVLMIVLVVAQPIPGLGPAPLPTSTVEDAAAMTGGAPTELATNPLPTETPLEPIKPYGDDATMKALEYINLTRIEQSLWPLKPNSTLNRLAQGQAGYLATLRDLPPGEAVHLGAEGNDPLHRAQAAGWPAYGADDKLEIGELAAAPSTPDLAIYVWQSKEATAAILFSEVYREVGVAAVPLPGRVVVVAVLGAEPGVLPALLDPASDMLYLTAERSAFATGGDWIGSPTRVQVIQSTTGSATDDGWVGWQPKVPAPITDKPFSVAYSDEHWLVTTQVDPQVDIAWLPEVIPTETPLPGGEVTSTEVASTEAPTAAPSEAGTPAPSAPPPTQAVVPSSPPPAEPTATSTKPPTPPPTSTPTPLITTNGGLTLVYDDLSLAVVNTSGNVIDLQKLTLIGSSITLTGTLWNTPYISAPINQFPAQDCVQVWAWNASNPGKPAGCRFMRSAIYVAPSEMFWKDAPFDVTWQGVKVVTCQPGAGSCEFAFP